ncbi:aminoglycoside phosphotransferase family protein [Pleomorphomonas sp. JP5]|uniref:aminoglycoside phosphotransferase family protein n=1 Tax=Pleomorphomonas sp. JP5 TaxID=2942998 RepID=UPI00204378F9|nr:aminoglycoside phosphotransferase family protein [Pleomorphomonas sp. JP5]MCM5557001.1 aminoglycoside phosphotransferase family protein [Pleomorphomonas sp. JP5]
MHSDDLPVTITLARRLIAHETPQWAHLPLHRVNSTGTDNALFRIGDKLVLRIPRRPSAVPALRKELDWLPRLAGLPLDIPVPRHQGRVNLGIDCPFGIFDWMEGDIASPDAIGDVTAAALSLAAFLKALRACPTDGAPVAGPDNHRRGVALEDMSEATLASIDAVADEIDAAAAVALWTSAVSARHAGPPVWLHGDLKADNLIARGGKLAGVIDWGLAATGDPAADYAVAWSWIDPTARDTFRQALALGDGDWLRGKAWALYGAVIALSYYRGGRNEPLCRQCRLTLSRLALLR